MTNPDFLRLLLRDSFRLIPEPKDKIIDIVFINHNSNLLSINPVSKNLLSVKHLELASTILTLILFHSSRMQRLRSVMGIRLQVLPLKRQSRLQWTTFINIFHCFSRRVGLDVSSGSSAMKNQALFSSRDKSKEIRMSSAAVSIWRFTG